VSNPLASTNHQESRKQKIQGLILMGLGLPGIFYLMEGIERNTVHDFIDEQKFVLLVVYFGSVNCFALGLILLLAGFKSLSVWMHPRLRKGLWVKLAGVNFLALCAAFAVLDDSRVFGDEWRESWLVVPALALFVLMAQRGIVFLRTGWKYEIVSAEEALKRDGRPPVVFIRSFKDDHVIVAATSRANKWYGNIFLWTAAVSIEQELASIMNRVGPVVAIGRPGEPLPELGAARLYVGDDQWQNKITEMMKQSRLVVIRGGTSANLWWEIEQAARVLPLRKLVIVVLGKGEETRDFNRGIEQRFGQPVNPRGERFTVSLFSWFLPFGKELGRIAYFGEDGRLYVQPIYWTMSLKGFVLAPYRPNQDSLESAFQKVFQQLDLPWNVQKRQSTATLLALFGGMLGLHHFYIGQNRKGALCVLFFWTFIPLILSLIDGVKFALADEEEFKRRFLTASCA
jgi:TM2 domain-containing membrane protein YozV